MCKPAYITKVFGYSDDIVNISDLRKPAGRNCIKELSCWEGSVRVNFSDGSCIRVTYTVCTPERDSYWQIKVTKPGDGSCMGQLMETKVGDKEYIHEYFTTAEFVSAKIVY